MGMQEFVVRRIAHLIITFWAFITILFLMFRALPGDPTSMYVQEGISEEERQQIIEDLGLDAPLHEQYFDYIAQLLTGSFGYSFMYREPVINIIVPKFWNTIILMGTAIILAYVLGVLIGSLLGWWRGTKREKVGLIAALAARSSPEFWVGILLLSIFVFRLGWLPSGGMYPSGMTFDTFWGRYFNRHFVWHMVLPVLTGVIYYMAAPTLLMRSTMLDVLNEDYIEIKKAEGIPEYAIVYKHAARNSILPVITVLALVSGIAIGGSLVIETVFNWPGMGREMVRSIEFNDYPLAQAAFFLMGAFVIIMNFIADITYAYLDPRIKYE